MAEVYHICNSGTCDGAAYEKFGEDETGGLHRRGLSKKSQLKPRGRVSPLCGRRFALEEMHADHVKPGCRGGQTTLENGQMLCHDCNWTKGKR